MLKAQQVEGLNEFCKISVKVAPRPVSIALKPRSIWHRLAHCGKSIARLDMRGWTARVSKNPWFHRLFNYHWGTRGLEDFDGRNKDSERT